MSTCKEKMSNLEQIIPFELMFHLFYLHHCHKGSGRTTLSSSSGIYIDTTPPIINNIIHLDLAWDTDEPSEFQGNNYSIAAFWNSEDMESGVGAIQELSKHCPHHYHHVL